MWWAGASSITFLYLRRLAARRTQQRRGCCLSRTHSPHHARMCSRSHVHTHTHTHTCLPQASAPSLYQRFVAFEKQHGDREGIEQVVVSKRR